MSEDNQGKPPLSISEWIEKYAGEFAPGYKHPFTHKFDLPELPTTEWIEKYAVDDFPPFYVENVAAPRHEIQFKPGGMAGIVLKAMRDRGWAMVSDIKPMTSTPGENQTTFTVNFEIELHKHGQRMPKAIWDSDLLEVCRELGITKANSSEAI